ncbi:MAG: putative phosphoglycolate phosphatase [Cyanobacteria bacterium RYN_339]|nr:putative phosphoglycolate phosphatase [Cyanobacteria bacterium RYN_339]
MARGLVVFDKDGVLMDFHRRWAAITHARAEALADFVDPEVMTALLGLTADDRVLPGGLLAGASRQESMVAAAVAVHQTGLPWHEAIGHARMAFDQADFDVDFDQSSQPLPGVVETVRTLHAAGWVLAIATTDQTDDAWKFLHHAGLAECFRTVIGADRVTVGKPDPGMFILACEKAGIAPADAVMVGDLDIDLMMGRAAGARLMVGVLSGVGDTELLRPHADLLMEDIQDLVGALA